MLSDKGAGYWERYVGSQSPLEFMQLAFKEAQAKGEDTCIYWALDDYLQGLDAMFGIGTAAQAPQDLEDCLLAFMFRELGVYTLQSWAKYGPKGGA